MRRLGGVVVGEEKPRLARASSEVLVAEVERWEVVLAEEKGITATVGLGGQGIHDQEVALKEKQKKSKTNVS